MTAPANVTADRMDRVVAGNWVHLGPIVLGDDTPDGDWAEVADVLAGGETTLLTLADDTLVTGPSNRLIRIGWS